MFNTYSNPPAGSDPPEHPPLNKSDSGIHTGFNGCHISYTFKCLKYKILHYRMNLTTNVPTHTLSHTHTNAHTHTHTRAHNRKQKNGGDSRAAAVRP